jgi:hypothetical protein
MLGSDGPGMCESVAAFVELVGLPCRVLSRDRGSRIRFTRLRAWAASHGPAFVSAALSLLPLFGLSCESPAAVLAHSAVLTELRTVWPSYSPGLHALWAVLAHSVLWLFRGVRRQDSGWAGAFDWAQVPHSAGIPTRRFPFVPISGFWAGDVLGFREFGNSGILEMGNWAELGITPRTAETGPHPCAIKHWDGGVADKREAHNPTSAGDILGTNPKHKSWSR